MSPFKPFLSPRYPFAWTQELDSAFKESKEAIISAIYMGVEIFDVTKRTCLRPDWSRQGVGYYLSQKHCHCESNIPDCCKDGWKVILVGSRFLHGQYLIWQMSVHRGSVNHQSNMYQRLVNGQDQVCVQ